MRFGLWFLLSFMSLGVESKRKMSDALTQAKQAKTIEMPAPTVWPIILAFGLTLVCRFGHQFIAESSWADLALVGPSLVPRRIAAREASICPRSND